MWDGLRGAARQEVLVGIAGGSGVVDRDDDDAGQIERRRQGLEGRVDEEEAGAGVAQDVADLLRVEPRVDRDEDAARGGHGEVRLDHRRDVGAQERDPVVLAQTRRLQGRGQSVDPLRKRAVVVSGAAIAVHDGGLVGEDSGAAAQEAERGELGAGDLSHGGSVGREQRRTGQAARSRRILLLHIPVWRLWRRC